MVKKKEIPFNCIVYYFVEGNLNNRLGCCARHVASLALSIISFLMASLFFRWLHCEQLVAATNGFRATL